MEQVKQTATEWLYEQLTSTLFDKTSGQHILEQAKEMEKEQIINSFDEGKSDGYKTAREWDEMIVWLSAEQYYNETFNQ
jgi:hypothetical protein